MPAETVAGAASYTAIREGTRIHHRLICYCCCRLAWVHPIEVELSFQSLRRRAQKSPRTSRIGALKRVPPLLRGAAFELGDGAKTTGACECTETIADCEKGPGRPRKSQRCASSYTEDCLYLFQVLINFFWSLEFLYKNCSSSCHRCGGLELEALESGIGVGGRSRLRYQI